MPTVSTSTPTSWSRTLEVGERQRVEIIKVLYRGAKILILDEPTAVLVPQEVEALFDNLRELKAERFDDPVHRSQADEVLEIADTITVLRQGQTVATVKPPDVTPGDLAELMVGSELPKPDTTESTVTTDVGLSVSGLTIFEGGRAVVENASLTVHRGEIVGIAGVEGNGQSELIGAIIGTEQPITGTITMIGDDITRWPVRKRREGGLGYVPQDRTSEGLLLKDATDEDLLPALRAVAAGRNYFSAAITTLLVEDYVRTLQKRGLSDSYHLLTDREKEVLHLLAEGRSNKEVATLLDLGLSTVETHRANLMQKLNLHNTAEIVLYAVRKGLIK